MRNNFLHFRLWSFILKVDAMSPQNEHYAITGIIHVQKCFLLISDVRRIATYTVNNIVFIKTPKTLKIPKLA